MTNVTLIHGDCLDELHKLDTGTVQMCVTSPPYYGLRDYGVDGQIGLEKTPEEYVNNLVKVFRELKRVLKDDGTLWLNIGDSYASIAQNGDEKYSNNINNRGNTKRCRIGNISKSKRNVKRYGGGNIPATCNLKPKDLIGIPWMVAFALRADGWYLRSEIIWHKPNPMPESVTDRPTKSHEKLFLLSKSQRYYYDADAIKEPCKWSTAERLSQNIDKQEEIGRVPGKTNGNMKAVIGKNMDPSMAGGAIGIENRKHAPYPLVNKRDVWSINTHPFKEAHFAVMPEKLAEPCILAGSKPGDIVIDPFNGAGTSGVVAVKNGRSYVGVDLNEEYLKIAQKRIKDAQQQMRLGI
jgi:DNA modification methylase